MLLGRYANNKRQSQDRRTFIWTTRAAVCNVSLFGGRSEDYQLILTSCTAPESMTVLCSLVLFDSDSDSVSVYLFASLLQCVAKNILYASLQFFIHMSHIWIYVISRVCTTEWPPIRLAWQKLYCWTFWPWFSVTGGRESKNCKIVWHSAQLI